MDLERLVKIAAALGFNPISVRWKLARLQRRLEVRKQQAAAQVNQLRYEHKICARCGRLMDRADKSCSACGDRASSWFVHFLGRLGVKAPVFLSATGLLGVLIFAAYARVTIASDGGLMGFDVPTLLRFGGHAPWLVREGEWWRLFTAMFLHIGLWHLAFNLMALTQLGPAVEQAIGRGWMLLLFMLTGLCGNLGSELFGLRGVSAGASGALMGLMGIAAVWGHREGTSIGRSVRDRMLRWALLTMVFGFVVGADNAAHLFGFLSGGVLGLVVRPGRWRQDWQRLAGLSTGVIGAASVVGVFALVMLPIDSKATLDPTALYDDPGYADLYEEAEAEELFGPWLEACRYEHEGKLKEAQLVLAAQGIADWGRPTSFSPQQIHEYCAWYGQALESCKECGDRGRTRDEDFQHYCKRICDALVEQ